MTRNICILALVWATPLLAQERAAVPFAITDNSFLVEEAFNQERGVFQNILVVQKVARDWSFEFTQEWPIGGVRHQLSYTVPIEATRDPVGGDYDVARGAIALNYRLQLLEESATRPAVSPRVSFLLPTDAGAAGYGIQLNLPASKQFGDFYVHGNAGFTAEGISGNNSVQRSTNVAGSLIYRAMPMVHLMLESVFATNQYADGNSLLISPGFRAGINFGKKQLVVGAAVPFGLLAGDEKHSLLTYFSYELPFRR